MRSNCIWKGLKNTTTIYTVRCDTVSEYIIIYYNSFRWVKFVLYMFIPDSIICVFVCFKECHELLWLTTPGSRWSSNRPWSSRPPDAADFSRWYGRRGDGWWVMGIWWVYWLVVSNMFGIFHMGCHPSHWRSHIFQRGRAWPWYTTNQSMMDNINDDITYTTHG